MPTQVFEMTDKSACKYWDCGWCYAPNYLKTNAINSTCVNPYECPISPLSEPVQYETPMTEIEELKAQIKVLQSKLSFLEELEKTKSPVEEAYKDWWGQYPELETDWEVDVTRWHGFRAGYHFAHAKKVVEKVQEEQKWDAVRESVKWCEEHPDKDPLDWLKPQTPEQVADGLKEAFREAVKQGVVSSSNKPQNLYDLIADCMVKYNSTVHPELICDILDALECWLPDDDPHDGKEYQYRVGWTACLKFIREKLK